MNYAAPQTDLLGTASSGRAELRHSAGTWAAWLWEFGCAIATAPRTERTLLACVLLNIPFQIGGPLWGQDQAISDLGSPGGLLITVASFALFGLYARLLLISLANRRRGERRPWRFDRALTVYFVIGLLSIVLAERPDLTIYQLWLFAHSYFLFTYIRNWAIDLSRVRWVVALLLLGLILNTAAAICIDFVGHTVHVTGFFAQMEQDPDLGVNRVGLPWSPNLAASYAATVLSLAFATLLSRPDALLRRLARVAVFAGLLRLALTWSRGGWLELLTSAGIIACFSLHRRWISWRLPLSVALIAALVAIPLLSRISQRLFSNDNGATESVSHLGTASGRFPLNQIAMEMIKAHPFFGVGVNNFPVRLTDYLTSETEHEYLATVHNNYLLIWSETGIIGLAAYLWVLSSLMRCGWRCFRNNSRLIAPLGLAFAAATAGLMLHMTVEKFIEGMDAFWVFAALAAALSVAPSVRRPSSYATTAR